jgi:hypothetical protein
MNLSLPVTPGNSCKVQAFKNGCLEWSCLERLSPWTYGYVYSFIFIFLKPGHQQKKKDALRLPGQAKKKCKLTGSSQSNTPSIPFRPLPLLVRSVAPSLSDDRWPATSTHQVLPPLLFPSLKAEHRNPNLKLLAGIWQATPNFDVFAKIIGCTGVHPSLLDPPLQLARFTVQMERIEATLPACCAP